MKTFSKDTFEFGEAKIVLHNKGAEVVVPDGMRKEHMGNLFVYEGGGDKDWMRLVVEIIWVAADLLPPPMAEEMGMEHLVDEGWQLEKWRFCWKLSVCCGRSC